jgi:hypothetical protein
MAPLGSRRRAGPRQNLPQAGRQQEPTSAGAVPGPQGIISPGVRCLATATVPGHAQDDAAVLGVPGDRSKAGFASPGTPGTTRKLAADGTARPFGLRNPANLNCRAACAAIARAFSKVNGSRCRASTVNAGKAVLPGRPSPPEHPARTPPRAPWARVGQVPGPAARPKVTGWAAAVPGPATAPC